MLAWLGSEMLSMEECPSELFAPRVGTTGGGQIPQTVDPDSGETPGSPTLLPQLVHF